MALLLNHWPTVTSMFIVKLSHFKQSPPKKLVSQGDPVAHRVELAFCTKAKSLLQWPGLDFSPRIFAACHSFSHPPSLFSSHFSNLYLWLRHKVWTLKLHHIYKNSISLTADKMFDLNVCKNWFMNLQTRRKKVWHLKATRDVDDQVVNFNKLLTKHLVSHLPRSAKKKMQLNLLDAGMPH